MKRGRSISVKKTVYWIVVLLFFYIFTSARATPEVIEVEKELDEENFRQQLVVIEKYVNVTKYKDEKVPYGKPTCEYVIYNFSKTYQYEEEFSGGEKIGICTFLIKNEESVTGTFSFYPQFLKPGKINDGPDIVKEIKPFETTIFKWNKTLDVDESLTCMLQSADYPYRIRCTYLEPIVYEVKKIPYTSEELRNVTEYVTVTTIKQNVTRGVYLNRFF